MKTSLRSHKMASVIQHEITPIIQQYISPHKIGFVTVTKVEVSVDLRIAEVYVNTINGPEGFEKTLNGMGPKLSYELSQKIMARRPIELRFKPDILAGLPAQGENF